MHLERLIIDNTGNVFLMSRGAARFDGKIIPCGPAQVIAALCGEEALSDKIAALRQEWIESRANAYSINEAGLVVHVVDPSTPERPEQKIYAVQFYRIEPRKS